MGGLNGLTAGTSGASGEDEGAMWVIKNLLKLNQGPQGSDKFAFPIMRQQLKNKFCAERVMLTGTQGNVIDALMVPCHSTYEKLSKEKKDKMMRKEQAKNQSHLNGTVGEDDDGEHIHNTGNSGSFSPSPLGCVMFCSPNAGLYELLSQVNKEASWVGWYTSLGFDVCLFNYRGYVYCSTSPYPLCTY